MKKILSYCGILLAILFIPFILSLFSSEVNWQSFDYLIAAVLLIILFVGIEFVKNLKSKKRYWVLAIFLITIILFWIELAVGIFNTPFAGR